MIATILFGIKYGLITAFGIFIASSFTGVRATTKTIAIFLLLFLCCGILELQVYLNLGYEATRQLYPLIVHLPLLLVLCIGYRKRLLTALTSTATAYMLCQPAKWFSLFFAELTASATVESVTYIIFLALIGYLSITLLSPCIQEMYNKDTRSIFIFGMIPLTYFVFDYVINSFSSLLSVHTQLVIEFLPAIMCFAFTVFCIVYYQEYEKNADAERREQLIRLAADQQEKEMQAIKKINMETHIIRHDLRFLLSAMATCLENDDKDTARKLLSEYTELVETTYVKRYCSNDMMNYIISNFAAKCNESNIEFDATVELDDLNYLGDGELLFASIVSNTLDNAFNAQLSLPPIGRNVNLMLKSSHNKLLLSVKNPFAAPPKFVNGMPVSRRKGHGYGTQGIRYLTERLGGNCQFSIQDGHFITRIII